MAHAARIAAGVELLENASVFVPGRRLAELVLTEVGHHFRLAPELVVPVNAPMEYVAGVTFAIGDGDRLRLSKNVR